MKKVIVFLLLFASIAFAQEKILLANSTLANSGSVTTYYTIKSDKSFVVDSIALSVLYTGEIDVDQLIVTKGLWNGTTFVAVATPDTTTLSIDNAASTTTGAVYTATSTGLNSLEGYDAIKIVFNAGSAGNDATDPNALKCSAVVRRRPTQ